MSEKRRRVGTLNTKTGDVRERSGALITSPWQGCYSVIDQIPTGEKDANGYDIMADLVAKKYVGPDGKEYYRNFEPGKTFINLNLFEDCAGRPPREED